MHGVDEVVGPATHSASFGIGRAAATVRKRMFQVDVGVAAAQVQQLRVHSQRELRMLCPPDVQLHEATAAALCLVDTGWPEEFQQLHVYSDGSLLSINDEKAAGWVFVVIAESTSASSPFSCVGWDAGPVFPCQEGLSSEERDELALQHSKLGFAHDSQVAEALALLEAVLWVLQQTKQGAANITFHVDFDLLVSFTCAKAKWKQPPHIAVAAKAMMRLLDESAKGHLAIHVKGHAGQPWNEYADVLAKSAARNKLCSSAPNLLPSILMSTTGTEWAWYAALSDEERRRWGLPAFVDNCMQIEAC